MMGLTRDDGAFEMIVDEPGTDPPQRHERRRSAAPADEDGRDSRRGRVHGRPAFAGVPVSGLVVDKETEAPLGYASVGAGRKAGRGHAGRECRHRPRRPVPARAGAGRLHVGRDHAGRGLRPGHPDVRVGDAGVSDVRLALAKGLGIAGKVTDAAGRGVSVIEVTALPSDGAPG